MRPCGFLKRSTERLQVVAGGMGGEGAGGEAALHEVAAGGSFPIDHLAGDKEAGELPDGEGVIQFLPHESAGGRDGFFERAGLLERDLAAFGGLCERIGGVEGAMECFQQCTGGRVQFPSHASFAEEVAAGGFHFGHEAFVGESGLEIDFQQRFR